MRKCICRSMDRTTALILAAVAGLATITSFLKRDAAAGRGISRADEPLAYWGIVIVSGAIALCFLVFACLR